MKSDVVEEVAKIYDWIDDQLAANPESAGTCNQCGQCCDFDAYDHRLYITSPELEYFTKAIAPAKLKQMVTDRCPYQQNGKCTVHQHRFAACRIFTCKGNSDFQSQLTEQALEKLKSLCEEFNIPYQYKDLRSVLTESPPK